MSDQEKVFQKEQLLQQSRYNGSLQSSNLNSFSLHNDQTNNLLFVLQGFQMVTSRSNVILVAVGGIVSFLIRIEIYHSFFCYFLK